MTRIKGIPVILISRTNPVEDELGSLIYEDKEIVVENVLVAPTSSDDILSTTNLYGKKAVYTLAIDELIPLDWNKKVYVESYE